MLMGFPFVYYVIKLITTIIDLEHDQQLGHLTSFNAEVRLSSMSALMEQVLIPDDARLLDETEGDSSPSGELISVLLAKLSSYGPLVKHLRICDPASPKRDENTTAALLQFDDTPTQDLDDSSDRERASGIAPLPASKLYEILSYCINLEVFEWCSAFSPPDGLCEVCILAPVAVCGALTT